MLSALKRKHCPPSPESALEERTQRGKPRIATARPVLAVALEVIEESQNERGVEVDELQGGRRLPDVAFGKLQQQTEGIAVGRDGAWAYGAVVGEMLGEEALHKHRKGRRG
jgi:hypothetical protein